MVELPESSLCRPISARHDISPGLSSAVNLGLAPANADTGSAISRVHAKFLLIKLLDLGRLSLHLCHFLVLHLFK